MRGSDVGLQRTNPDFLRGVEFYARLLQFAVCDIPQSREYVKIFMQGRNNEVWVEVYLSCDHGRKNVASNDHPMLPTECKYLQSMHCCSLLITDSLSYKHHHSNKNIHKTYPSKLQATHYSK